jgi:PAS domain-containing protein
MDDYRALTDHAGLRLTLIAESFTRLTGHALVDSADDLASALWTAPRVILAHGTEPDPIFFYANRAALDLFELSAADIVRMPSRLSAEAPLREERMRLLDRVTRDGFIDDYAGVRVSAAGRRFRIEQAIVWNLIDEAGAICGQAATFDRWTRLD